MARPPRVVVLGGINMDLIAIADRMPSPGETVGGTDLYVTPGGKGANQAVAAARMGADVRMVGRVGGDVFGPMLIRSLEDAGVDVSSVSTDEETPSGIAMILLDARRRAAPEPHHPDIRRQPDRRGFPRSSGSRSRGRRRRTDAADGNPCRVLFSCCARRQRGRGLGGVGPGSSRRVPRGGSSVSPGPDPEPDRGRSADRNTGHGRRIGEARGRGAPGPPTRASSARRSN